MKHVLILLTLIIVCQLSTRAEENDTLFFDNGSWYAGQIEDSLFNGFGVMRYPDETLYSGQWKDGLWHGIGELFFPDGDKYSGEFSNHTIEGEGEYFYYNGAKYQGGWRNNMFNGAGTMYYTDGGYYAGNWQDDKRHGYGLLFSGADSTLYQGYFYLDAFIGTQPYQEVTKSDPKPFESNSLYQNYIPLENLRNYYFNIGAAFSMESFLLLNFSVEKSRWIWGITAGGQLDNPGIGEKARYTDEEGNLIIIAGWNEYPVDELREDRYTLFTLGFDSGFKLSDYFIMGGGLGFGVDMRYKNCKCKGSDDSCPDFSVGQLYYKNKLGGFKFGYKLFSKYYLPLSPKDPYSWEHDICLNVGYGNLEGFFIGAGIRF